jgi:hypothetical protein
MILTTLKGDSVKNKILEGSKINKPSDKPSDYAKLRSFGVMPKGNTGCTTCDSMGFIFCRCPARGGKASGGGEDERKEDAKGKRSATGTDQLSMQVKSSTTLLPIIPKPEKLGQLPKLIIAIQKKTHVKMTAAEIKALKNTLAAMKEEFKKFIDKLGNQDIPIDKSKYKAEIIENSLVLTIPNAKHHDDFITHLMSKGFVSTPSPTTRQNQDFTATKGSTTPTPLRTTLILKPPGL